MDVAGMVRIALALAVVALLGRAARPAWRNRRLALAVWRRIRVRHVAGCLGLLLVVVSVMALLLALVPPARFGLGTLVGLSGNVVFAPIEESAARAVADGTVAGGTDWAVVAGVTAFLVLLLALFPWLAYVEERAFREGLEDATLGEELWSALRFGLLHLIMLIPLGAALAVGVAGFAYGRIYRSAYRRAAGRRQEVAGPFGVPVVLAPSRRTCRDEAVLTATVWHATFNSMIVLLVGVGLLLAPT